jgi:pyruvate-ferredoxin/flavodoxin oxidoreductase
MARTQTREKLAVESGYWHLWRYIPENVEQARTPRFGFQEPTGSFQEFLNSEVRYTSLKQTFPEVADELFKKAEAEPRPGMKATREWLR